MYVVYSCMSRLVLPVDLCEVVTLAMSSDRGQARGSQLLMIGRRQMAVRPDARNRVRA